MEKLFNELEWLKRQFSQGKWDLISGYVKKTACGKKVLPFFMNSMKTVPQKMMCFSCFYGFLSIRWCLIVSGK